MSCSTKHRKWHTHRVSRHIVAQLRMWSRTVMCSGRTESQWDEKAYREKYLMVWTQLTEFFPLFPIPRIPRRSCFFSRPWRSSLKERFPKIHSPPLPFPFTKSPPWQMKSFSTRWMREPRYVSGFPQSPMGIFFLSAPLLQSVAKFSHAIGATVQCNLTTILWPDAGGLVLIPPTSLFFELHSRKIRDNHIGFQVGLLDALEIWIRYIPWSPEIISSSRDISEPPSDKRFLDDKPYLESVASTKAAAVPSFIRKLLISISK